MRGQNSEIRENFAWIKKVADKKHRPEKYRENDSYRFTEFLLLG